MSEKAVETELSLPCSMQQQQQHDGENGSKIFWSLIAKKLASVLEESRGNNVQLENSVKNAERELADLQHFYEQLLKELQLTQ